MALGLALYQEVALTSALHHLEQGLTFCDPTTRHALHGVLHPEIVCLLMSEIVLWYLGYPDRARTRIHEGLDVAQQLAQRGAAVVLAAAEQPRVLAVSGSADPRLVGQALQPDAPVARAMTTGVPVVARRGEDVFGPGMPERRRNERAGTAYPVFDGHVVVVFNNSPVDRFPLAAALSVAVPWLAMSFMLMTESAAYPAFAWALVGIQRAVAEPSPPRDLLALGQELRVELSELPQRLRDRDARPQAYPGQGGREQAQATGHRQSPALAERGQACSL